MKLPTLLVILSFGFGPAFSQNAQPTPKVEVVMPTYPGGETALFQYISDSLKYPQRAIEKGVTGIVVTSFVIEENGTVGSIEVVQGIGAGCDEAAVDVIGKMSNWIPASKGGKTVRVQYMMPIQFDLQQDYPSNRKKKKN